MQKKLVNSQVTNYQTYLMYLRQMLCLAENVFVFDNLPNEIDVAFMNKTLLHDGSICFFKDEVLGVIALPYSVLGEPDIYGRPKSVMARAYNGRYFRKLNKGEFYIMYDNNGRYPLYLDIIQMAERVALTKRTIDVNVVQQRTPRVWKTTAEKELSVKRMMNDIDAMQENVTTYDSLDIEDLECVLAPAPYVADSLDLRLEKEWSEFYRLVGIASLMEQKRERVIKDEVQASQGGTIASRYSRYQPREKACKEINQLFGLDMSVKFYDGIPEMINNIENIESEGVDDVTNVLPQLANATFTDKL